MRNHCPVCSKNQILRSFSYKANSDLLQAKRINICSHCSLGFISPFPSDKDWIEYNSKYFLNAHGGVSSSNDIINYKNALAKMRYQYICDFIDGKKSHVKYILEIGPGEGYLAKFWKSRHPDIKYFADESDSSVHKKLIDAGATVLKKNQNIENNSVDLVIISHVLEHTLDPVGFIKNSTAQLKAGGTLFLEVPAEDYRYKNIYEPHTLFFNNKSMSECMIKSNLKIKKITQHGNSIFAIKYFETLRKVAAKIMKKLPKKIISFFLSSKLKNILEINEYIASFELAPYKTRSESGRWLRILAEKE